MSAERRVLLKISDGDGDFGTYEAAIVEEEGRLFAVEIDLSRRTETSMKLELSAASLQSRPSRDGILMFEYQRPVVIPK
jgi:hypothetical protein